MNWSAWLRKCARWVLYCFWGNFSPRLSWYRWIFRCYLVGYRNVQTSLFCSLQLWLSVYFGVDQSLWQPSCWSLIKNLADLGWFEHQNRRRRTFALLSMIKRYLCHGASLILCQINCFRQRLVLSLLRVSFKLYCPYSLHRLSLSLNWFSFDCDTFEHLWCESTFCQWKVFYDADLLARLLVLRLLLKDRQIVRTWFHIACSGIQVAAYTWIEKWDHIFGYPA